MRKNPTWLACMIAGTLGAPGADAADWPGWRGPNRDATSRETGLLAEWPASGPPLAWKVSGVGAGFSSVAAAAGRIYTMGDSGGSQHVLALDASDGRLLWSARVGPAWSDQYGGSRSTPSVDGELLYALGTEGDLVCLETATGRERWRKSLPRDFGGVMMSGWKFSESPLVDGDRLVFTAGARDAALVAVDKRTGATIWKAAVPDLGPRGRDGAAYSSIVISNGAGVKQYVQLMGRGLVGIRASDGKFLWGYNRVANDTANIATPLVRLNWVFASTGYQTGAALLELSKTPEGGVAAKELYFLEPGSFQNHHGGMVLVGSNVFAGHGHNKGFPICLDLVSGKTVWGGDIRNAGSGSAAVMYADGRLYFRYQNGVVLLIEASAAGYKERGSFTIPDVRSPSWPHLVVADGRLYVREQDTLYAYDVRARPSASLAR
ncbi:MAG TPA: PQQ-binding-like beta-propeller repeat protein [Vicinamibacteria bacterium]|nr:PQQ-binding-like beta-propeller repeat protein [Vicinamibacteria bacterium]